MRNDKNIKNGIKVRWKISQKILGIIFLLVMLYTAGTTGATVLSNYRNGQTIDKKFDEVFGEIFTSVGRIFDDFEGATKENIRKTSGLFSLEKVWSIFLKGHEKYLENTKKKVSDGRQELLTNLELLYSQNKASMDRISDVSSKMLDERTKRRFLPLLEKARSEMVESENIFKTKEKSLWNSLLEDLESSGKHIDEEVRNLSDEQIKNAIEKMGKSNVMLVGSQEVNRRQIEDIKYRAADSVKKSIQDSNTVSIITLIASMIVVTIFVVIIALFLAHSVTKPISKMVEVLQSMSKGELPNKMVEVKSSDEIGMLAVAFNEMATNLKNVTASRDELNKEIAERRKAQEEAFFRDIVLSSQSEVSNNGILIVDENEKIILINRRFIEMWEIPPDLRDSKEDAVVLKSVLGRVVNSDAFLKGVRYYYDHPHEKGTEEIVLTDGRTFERYTSSMFDPSEKYYGRVWYFHDITARKKVTEELRKAYDELKTAQAQLVQSEKMVSIGQLAAGVAHEINNPMGFISNNMEVLRQYVAEYIKILKMTEGLKGSIEAGDLEKIKLAARGITQFEQEINLEYINNDIDILLQNTQKGIERVQKIILDLRTFAREDTEAMELIKIEEVIDYALNIVRSELKYKAELKKDYGNIPMIKCHSQRLGQVFINLFVNAAQAIEGKGVIEVKTYADNQHVYIDVKDTGKGIKEEDLNKIFDPFFTTKAVGQGTGLGLSVSHEIIKKHGGKIRVKSKVGEGTTFTIVLPINNV